MKLYIQLPDAGGWQMKDLPALRFSKRKPLFNELDELIRKIERGEVQLPANVGEDRDAAYFIALSRSEEKKLSDHVCTFTRGLSKDLNQSQIVHVLSMVLECHYSMKAIRFQISTFPSDAQYDGQKPQIVFWSKQRLSV